MAAREQHGPDDRGRDDDRQGDGRDHGTAPTVGRRDHLAAGCCTGGRRELAAARVAIGRSLRKRSREDGVEGSRQLRLHDRQLRRRLVEMREDHGELALARVRPHAGQAFEEHAAERVHVGPQVDRPALDLLRWDVVDRADEASLAGEAAHRRRVSREAEVAEIRVLPAVDRGDEDVAGLDVAVDEAGRMSCVERLGDLRDQRERAVGLERSLAAEQLAQVGPVDVRHREEQPAVDLSRRDRRGDVGMVERRRDLRLAQEALAKPLLVGKLGCEHLERDAVAGADVLGEVDGARRALGDQGLDAKVPQNRAASQ